MKQLVQAEHYIPSQRLSSIVSSTYKILQQWLPLTIVPIVVNQHLESAVVFHF